MANACRACGNSGIRILRAGYFAGIAMPCPRCHSHPETYGEVSERLALAYERLVGEIWDAVKADARRIEAMLLGSGKE